MIKEAKMQESNIFTKSDKLNRILNDIIADTEEPN